MLDLSQESTLRQLNDFGPFLGFKRTWILEQFIRANNRVCALLTGNQYGKCLTGGSMISTPSGEISLLELFYAGTEFDVYSYSGGSRVIKKALPPFKKPKKEPCVRVKMSDGKWFEAALGHRVLTTAGWLYIKDLLCSNRTRLSSSPQFLQESSSEPCRLVQTSDGLRCWRKELGCPGGCSTDYRLNGEQPLSDGDTGQLFSQPPVYAQRHNSPLSDAGVSESGYTCNHRRLLPRLSSLDVISRLAGRFAGFLAGGACTTFQSLKHAHPLSEQLPTGGVLALQSNILGLQDQSLFSSPEPPLVELINGNQIISFSFIGCQDVYDFTVPETHNYYAAGVIHHNTASVAYSYVLRIMGLFPVAKKNVVYWECAGRPKAQLRAETVEDELWKTNWLREHGDIDSPTWNVTCIPEKCPSCGGEVVRHERGSTAFRFASETLPGQSSNIGEGGESAETKNTQYPEFKKWLPPFLIKKDITQRDASMILHNPLGGKDIIIDFVSYNQDVQGTAGVQRISIWYDEEPSYELRKEQRPRLLAEDGDEVFSLTPARFISWMFDEIYEKARIYYRTEHVCDFLKSNDYSPQRIEEKPSDHDIAVFQAATDDNPTLSPEVIQSIHGDIDDPDELAIRRFGIFKQVSGRIFKDFDYKCHVIDDIDYFPNGIPDSWVHARGIDFHPRTPWGFACMSLSPDNEAFIWADWDPNPEKMTLQEIAMEIGLMGKEYKFRLNLIDPLSTASMIEKKTSLDHLNEHFYRMHRDDICPSANWRKWDTKGEQGRDEIKKRLKNAKRVGKPFNNKVVEGGRTVVLPTIWVFRGCKIISQSMKQWRWEEYADSRSRLLKGVKNMPEQRWSHHCMVLEAIFKESSFKPGISEMRERPAPQYFQRRK